MPVIKFPTVLSTSHIFVTHIYWHRTIGYLAIIIIIIIILFRTRGTYSNSLRILWHDNVSYDNPLLTTSTTQKKNNTASGDDLMGRADKFRCT